MYYGWVRYVSSAGGRVVETVSTQVEGALRLETMGTNPKRPVEPNDTALEGSQLRARTIGNKGADAPRCKTGITVA